MIYDNLFLISIVLSRQLFINLLNCDPELYINIEMFENQCDLLFHNLKMYRRYNAFQ